MAYFHEGSEQMNALEAMVDATDVATVLYALEAICYAKAEHLRTNWQDDYAAKGWARKARRCYNAAIKTVSD